MAVDLQWGAPTTYDDLADMPDDGHRRELINGQLLVTPAPIPRHQLCVGRIFERLSAVAPADFVALVAPVDWKVSDLTVVEPDVLVTYIDDLDGAYLSRTPLLVVEVLSPATRLTDRGSKRLLYESAGVGDYWIVDPEAPSLLALHLEDGTYHEIGHAEGDQTHAATTPFALAVVPSELVKIARS